jgi:hypothetical protein
MKAFSRLELVGCRSQCCGVVVVAAIGVWSVICLIHVSSFLCIYEDVPFPRNFRDIVKNIFKRLFRVYAHIYYSHFHKIVSLGEEAHLNTCMWIHKQQKSLCKEDSHVNVCVPEQIWQVSSISTISFVSSVSWTERKCNLFKSSLTTWQRTTQSNHYYHQHISEARHSLDGFWEWKFFYVL